MDVGNVVGVESPGINLLGLPLGEAVGINVEGRCVGFVLGLGVGSTEFNESQAHGTTMRYAHCLEVVVRSLQIVGTCAMSLSEKYSSERTIICNSAQPEMLEHSTL
jgi:hypothetical protein